ncbi:hypothetical protein HK102_010078 [Quaeritorhiza haematococci]|nr:hypothetical protein HK102_010078 [Quaeritorhiza haematococci]
MGKKLKVFVSTGESRTADGIIKEFLEGDSPFKQYIDQVTTIYPSDVSTQNDELINLGAKVLQMDTEKVDPSDMAKQLKGHDVAILIPPASSEKVKLANQLCRAVKDAGVKNIIIVSSCAANMIEKPSLKMFKEIEEGVKRELSDRTVCIVRAGHYFQNLLLYAKQMQENGFLGLPTDNKPMSPVDARDVAGVIANIAINDGNSISEKHMGECYELTGVEELTGDQIAKIFKENGMNTTFKSISRSEAENYLRSLESVDESEIQLIQDEFDLIREGKLGGLSPHMQQLLGREPLTMSDFVREYADVFKGKEE